MLDDFKDKYRVFKKNDMIPTFLNNKIVLFVINLVKFSIAIIFLPLFLVFSLFQIKIFSKVVKQVVAILYFFTVLVMIYTLININKPIGNDESVIVNVEYKDKIQNF